MSTPPYLVLQEGEAFIALGANLGEPAIAIARALEALGRHDRVRILATSRVHDTAPVGPPQPRYLNAVTWVATSLGPEALLALLLDIEVSLGRVRVEGERWGPRVIDLDLIAHGARRLVTPSLTLPHPRAHERLFVLAPLADLVDPATPGGVALRDRIRQLAG